MAKIAKLAKGAKKLLNKTDDVIKAKAKVKVAKDTLLGGYDYKASKDIGGMFLNIKGSIGPRPYRQVQLKDADEVLEVFASGTNISPRGDFNYAKELINEHFPELKKNFNSPDAFNKSTKPTRNKTKDYVETVKEKFNDTPQERAEVNTEKHDNIHNGPEPETKVKADEFKKKIEYDPDNIIDINEAYDRVESMYYNNEISDKEYADKMNDLNEVSKHLNDEGPVDRAERMYNDGKISEQEYFDILNEENDKVNKQQTQQKTQQQNKQQTQKQTQQKANPNQSKKTSPPPPPDTKDIFRTYEGDNYKTTIKNNALDSMEVDGVGYRLDDQGRFRRIDTDAVIDGDELTKIQNIAGNAKRNYYKSLTDDDWNQMLKDPKKFGLGDDFDERKMFDSRINIWDQEVDRLNEVHRKTKTKKDKAKIKDELDAAKKERINMKHRKNIWGNEQQYNESVAKAQTKFNKAVQDLAPGSAEYKAAQEELEKAISRADKVKKSADATAEAWKKGSIKGVDKNVTKIGVVSTVFSLKQGVDKYKEERAEGKSVISAGIRAGATVAINESIGIVGAVGLGIAQAAPQAAVSATRALYHEYRSMNSAANFQPLGGASFQDSQQLATMRQSGMELAKMSQYNLEQTLMGAEAKHLHR